MAGIGFELRKLFRKQGLTNQLKAYAYSTLATVGPMILVMFLIVAMQKVTSTERLSYLDWQLYIATVTYSFIFSIVFTSGLSMLLTRYVADMLFKKKYNRLMSAYYGALIVLLPIVAIVATIFLHGVTASWIYKLAAYFFFMSLVIIWIQGLFLSAIKDYMRIVRWFAIGSGIAICSGWLLSRLTSLESINSALIGIDIGFLTIVILSNFHFEKRFPRVEKEYLFEYLSYFKKYLSLFFAGCFVYSGIYLHNFVYWLGPNGIEVADQFLTMPYYDLPVFFAFISVLPTFVVFVVSVETSFYEKFRLYYLNVINGGTIRDIINAKIQMQKSLVKVISFLVEVQLLFTIISIAIGIKFLPRIGFTMEQIDLFMILTFSYFLFIIFFVLTHILMYFDDRKGVLGISIIFAFLNIVCSYWMMQIDFDGLGMFIASIIALALVIARLLYVLQNIDYYTFSAQPINQQIAKKKHKLFGKAASTTSIFLISLLLLSACTAGDTNSEDTEIGETDNEIVNRASMPEERTYSLTEDKKVYERDDDSSLKTLYITVLPYKKSDENFNWYALNRQTDKANAKKLPIIMQEGLSDEGRPRSGMFGYGTTTENATIELRGNTTWYSSQKSFKIKLHDDAGLYMGQRTINLNKHRSDFSRIRNKLSFDLMEKIPNITSLRTQFIHLYVKDLSTGQKDAPYVDYGLFTHVEQPNKMFLKSHMLDPNGYLYKTTFFEFERYEEQIKDENDPEFNEENFESILKIKGRKEHGKLIKMLEDVNDLSIPIEEVMAMHFDEENFLTWIAINILMDNMDTDSHNYYLYSPINSNKWYILPWDYDGAWEQERRSYSSYRMGISNYWVQVLANRYFRIESNVEKLKDKVEELHNHYINKETIEAQIKSYKDVVKPFLYRHPDVNFLPAHAGDYEKELDIIKQTPEASIKRFYEDLEKPKPYYMDDVEDLGNKLKFSWGVSFDLQDDELFYDFEIAKDLEFTNVVYEQRELKSNVIEINKLPPGTYYWRSSVRDHKGNRQFALDYIRDNGTHDGVIEFEVK